MLGGSWGRNTLLMAPHITAHEPASRVQRLGFRASFGFMVSFRASGAWEANRLLVFLWGFFKGVLPWF